MATNIKTRILLPRGTVDSFSTRTFTAGELVLINSGSKFKPVEITSAGTGLTGDGAAAYAELELSALQIKLSSDVTLQSAYDSIAATVNGLSTYAQIATQLSNDGYALDTNVNTLSTNLSNEIQSLSSALSGDIRALSTALSTDIDNLEDSIIGTDADLSSADTIYGAKKYAKQYTDQEAAKKNAVKIAQSFSGAQTQSDLSVIKVTDSDLTAYSAALQSGSLDPNALYVLNLSATNALGQKIENVAAGTVSSDAATYGQLTAAVENITGNYATKQELNSVSDALSTDYLAKVKAVDDKLSGYYLKTETSSATEINNALTAVNDSLTAFVEKSALSISYDSTAKKIYLSGGTAVSEIDASDFIKDGMLSAATYDADSKNIILSFNTDAGATPISVDVGDLVDTYTAGDTSTIDMSVSDNTFTASIIDGSITPSLLSSTADWVFDCNL